MDTRNGRTQRGGAEGGDQGREEGWRCLGRDGQIDCQTGVGEETDRHGEGGGWGIRIASKPGLRVENIRERGQEAWEETSRSGQKELLGGGVPS